MKSYPPNAVAIVAVPKKSARYGADEYRRLAAAIKSMGRYHGWRVVSIGPASAEAAALKLLDAMPELAGAARDDAA